MTQPARRPLKKNPRSRKTPGDTLSEGTVSHDLLDPARIHPNVVFICRRLSDHGHEALVVGGAVRDLLLGRNPKDFDLSTSARPEEVKRLFRNARIIGRRFKLVQVRFPDMSVEISTFRAEPGRKKDGMILRDNRYGTLQEDVVRRDFTINALTFDPLTGALVDTVGALDDLKAGILRTIKPPDESYQEDPVRMLRAVRFKSRMALRIDPECEAAIPRNVKLLRKVSRHRLADELQRLLTSGHAEHLGQELERLGLLAPLLNMEPYPWFFQAATLNDPLRALQPFLIRMDRWTTDGQEPVPPTVALLGLLVSLGPPWLRRHLRPPSPTHPPGKMRLDGRLAAMFAEWGFLNGQVHPALSILRAAHGLSLQGDPGAVRPYARGSEPAGIREAWQLLGILQDVLEIPVEFVSAGLKRLHLLPDLPILDHPRPPRHRRGESLARSGAAKTRHRRRRKRSARRPAEQKGKKVI